MSTSKRGTRLLTSIATKVLFSVGIAMITLIAILGWRSINLIEQISEQDVERHLNALYENYNDQIQMIERASATLSLSFADRPDVQELFLAQDREGLLELLTPVFETLKTEYNIVHFYVEDPAGEVFVRIHNPTRFGDDVTYRRTVAAAQQLRQTISGVEIGPNRLGIRSVSPMFHLDENEDSQGEFIGMVEVGLDYDQPFIDDLKARNNADYKMWVTFEAAEAAGLGPGEDTPDAPIAELFYYAATDPTPLSIPKEVYRRVIHDRRPEIQSVSVAGEELTVLLAPMLAYGGRIIGVLEIRMVQTGPLSSMTQTRNNALILVGGLALLMLTVIGLTINLIVLRPLRHLANVAQSQLEGDMSARVQLSTRDEFGQLGLVFNTLTESLDNVLQGLESIVDERTHDLARRTAYQAASAEVSRAAASILDIDQLIRRMVELIRERFEFHYVGLFLVDETGEWAVLRDGTGESGQALLARGLRVRVGEGMIGWSIASAQSRVAAQASSDAQRLTLPELPDTRTEAALPLRSRGQVLGALSIEHDQADVFDQDTVTVLQTMADQIAVALDNARLLAANRETMQAERQAYGDLSRDAWAQMLRARGAWGFRYTKQASGIASQVVPAEGAWRSEMVQATQMGQSIVGDSTGEQTLAIPLKVREQVVGVLSFCKSEDSEDSNGETWTTGEIDLLEALVEQLSMALESARLYQDTQLHAAREQLTREITDEMRRNVDVEAVLRSAVTSLGQALGAPRTYVRLTIDEGRPKESESPENGGANQYQEPAQGPSEETLLRWASLPGAKEPAPSPPKGDERNES